MRSEFEWSLSLFNDGYFCCKRLLSDKMTKIQITSHKLCEERHREENSSMIWHWLMKHENYHVVRITKYKCVLCQEYSPQCIYSMCRFEHVLCVFYSLYIRHLVRIIIYQRLTYADRSVLRTAIQQTTFENAYRFAADICNWRQSKRWELKIMTW